MLKIRKNSNKKKAQQVIPIKSSSLLAAYDEAIGKKEHPYDLLKKRGYIKNPFEEFAKAK